MKIKFRHCRRKRIRKFLSGFHGKERTDLYKIFTAIAYLVYTGCQWKMLPRYLMGRKLPSHSLVLFFISFGHDGTPSLPQELKKITQQLTALPLTFIVVPALIFKKYILCFAI